MKLLNFFRRIRGVSTPFGGFSLGEETVDKHLKDAFSLGFDLNLLQGLGIMNAGKEDIAAYNSQRVLLEERAKRAGFPMDLPVSVSDMSGNEVVDRFKNLNQEILARLQAVKESYFLPFSLGRWLADTLSATAGAQSANPKQISQLFAGVIDRFDLAKQGARELGASSAIVRDLSGLHDHISKLSKLNQVTSVQYAAVSEKSLDIFKRLMSS